MSGSSQTGNRSLETGDSQWRRWRAAAVRWVVAIVSVAAAVILAQVLERYWESTPFVSLFLCAIMFSAWFGGFKPGLLAIALSVLAFDYYFLPPTHSLVMNFRATFSRRLRMSASATNLRTAGPFFLSPVTRQISLMAESGSSTVIFIL